ncbi:tetratricopeptide repeat protein [Okeania sp. SIO1I7]|uniref:tetratricopeptide repeat protein n=1 Tax=Okeania sp. SIO1I7 TaxID=2607772 RepID=UPI0013FAF453|nr:tetratricopeptide repeat protein [Okeania sp. SIO1I7]NET26795.1 tetratricopeptide repeat protein [Okeania sp. SIO1I7]
MKKAKDYFKVAQEAFKDALEINDQYARAYLAQGALLYGQKVQSIGKWGNERIVEEKIDEAIVQYRKALDAEIKHPKAYVDIKANYNLGLAITVKENLQPSYCSQPNEEAIEALQNVISAYDRETIIDIIQQLTAKAYYQLGLLYRNCSDRKLKEADKLQLYDDAVKEFKNSILLFSTKPEKDWQQDIWAIRLSLANTYLLSAELGKTDMYQQAIDIYNEIIQHYEEHQNISTNIAAETYYNLGLALTQTNNTTKAAEKYRQVLDLEAPPEFQEKLILKSLQNKAHVQLGKLQE